MSLPNPVDVASKADAPPVVSDSAPSGEAEPTREGFENAFDEPTKKPVQSQPEASKPEAETVDKPQANKPPASVPYKRFQEEIQKRKELEAYKQRYEQSQPALEQFKQLNAALGEYAKRFPKEAQQMLDRLAGKSEQIADTQAQAASEIEETGQVDPETRKLLAKQVQEMQALKADLQDVKKARDEEKRERELAEQTRVIEGEFEAAYAKYPQFKGNEEVRSMAISIAYASNGSVTEALEKIAKLSMGEREATLKSLAEKEPRRQGTKVQTGSGPSAVPQKTLPKFGSDAHTEAVVADFMSRYAKEM